MAGEGGWSWTACVLLVLALDVVWAYTAGWHRGPKGMYSEWVVRHSPHPWFLKTWWNLRPSLQYVDKEALLRNRAEGRPQIFCSHPHGVLSLHHGMFMTRGHGFQDIVPGHERRSLGASVLFLIPGWRLFILSHGAVDASRKIAMQCLKQALSLTILVGGEHEQLLSNRVIDLPAEEQKVPVVVKGRYGFCRLAVLNQCPVVPCFNFGENEMYHQPRVLWGLRCWLQKTLGVAVTLPYGPKWWWPLRPYEVQLCTVLCSPLEPAKVDNALARGHGDEEVEKAVKDLHARYMASLTEIFEKRKVEFGYAKAAQLEFH